MNTWQHDFGLIFWAHLLLIIGFIMAPFLIGWHYIVLMAAIFYGQNIVFKNCLLTKAQLNNHSDIEPEEISFYVYYFKKIGLKINARWVKKYFAWTLLWTVLVFSLLWQLLWHKTPVWFGNLF